MPPLDFSRYWEGEDLPPGTKITDKGWAEVPAGFYHFTGHIAPLRNAESLKEIEEFPIADVSQYDTSHYPEAIERARREGRPTSTWTGHMYEIAWQIRGYEEFLMDMVERPAWAECLLDRLFENNLFTARKAAEAGLDAIYCGDDVANQQAPMFSLDMWRNFMLSRWAKVWRAAKEIKPDIKIHYHSDGNVLEYIEDMVDAGLDILNPAQPECLDIDRVHRQWGDHLTLDGCIGTQSTMPWGTPDDVRARVREVIDKYGRNGGLIISPTHTLEPEVPIANIEALVEACQAYGRAPAA
jgi:uroporphyrinogen decarboxylase